ncbi:hypothetical protein H0H87_003911 [Tephrocybe sp. NHM501043]|nr:hypothetical protein H0H87_003911 [Tephrocybe sp. NHM501043]
MSRPTLPNRKGDSSGRVPKMKGCLKTMSPGVSGCPPTMRKSVAFGEEICEEVYFADVWDRTPTEPARKLTYQDLLELKEIQRSLPRANQLADPISGKPASHFLNQVPIGLLPLLSETETSSPASSTVASPAVSPPTTPLGVCSQSWALPPPTPRPPPPPVVAKLWAPPHLQHLLPKSPPPQRQKPSFAFLPLLETPPSSAAPSPFNSHPSSRSPSPDHSDTDHSQDPPTPSLTDASLESSPLSRASSASPEPPFLSLADHDYFDLRGRRSPSSYSDSHAVLSPSLRHLRTRSTSPPALSPTTAWHAFPDRSKIRAPSISPQRSDISSSSARSESNSDVPPGRRRNVMIVNGIEIDLDEDDEDDLESQSSTPSTSNPHPATPLLPPIPTSPPSARTPTRQLSPDIERSLPSPKLSCSPSSPGRCSMALHSPIRFQRDKNRAPHGMGFPGIASP